MTKTRIALFGLGCLLVGLVGVAASRDRADVRIFKSPDQAGQVEAAGIAATPQPMLSDSSASGATVPQPQAVAANPAAMQLASRVFSPSVSPTPLPTPPTEPTPYPTLIPKPTPSPQPTLTPAPPHPKPYPTPPSQCGCSRGLDDKNSTDVMCPMRVDPPIYCLD